MKVAHWSHVLQAMRYDEWSEMARNATADGYQVMQTWHLLLQRLQTSAYDGTPPQVVHTTTT